MADGAHAKNTQGRSLLNPLLALGGSAAALLGFSGLMRSFVGENRQINWASGLIFLGALLITAWGLRSQAGPTGKTMNDDHAADLLQRRNRWWMLGGVIVAGWGLAGLLLAAPGLVEGSWVRLGTFLSLTMAPGLIGREWLIKKNGSVDFPVARK
jgi:hypothetical protein